VVYGHLEDSGTWLRLAQGVFLPMRVGAVEILKPVEVDRGEVGSPFGGDATANQSGRGGGARTAGKGEGLANLPWCGGCDPGTSPARITAPESEVLVLDNSAQQAQAQQALLRSAREGESTNAVAQHQSDAGHEEPRVHDSLEGCYQSGPLTHLDEASRLLSGSEPINPFTDTPRGGSPNNSPLKSRLLTDPMAPINPFSDTPPGGNSPRVTPMRMRPPSSFD